LESLFAPLQPASQRPADANTKTRAIPIRMTKPDESARERDQG
jgi:hypothetical protein